MYTTAVFDNRKFFYRLLQGLGVLLVALLFNRCSSTSELTIVGEDQRPLNVVLMLGDGMGLSQISAALFQNDNALSMERMPVMGYQKTHSADNLVTDSGAAATAMACGMKTFNFSIGLGPDSVPCKTLVEVLSDHHFATGFVVTSPVNHATPAAFYSHVNNRIHFERIAADLVQSDIDFFVGGGRKYFHRRDSDQRNLLHELEDRGFTVADYLTAELDQLRPNAQKKFAYFTADTRPLPASAGRDYLRTASWMGTRFLSRYSTGGFFLMVEGSQIDWGGHSNNLEHLIEETLDFDRAVREVLRFAESNGRTLVIVTADHEAGGLGISRGSSMGDIKGEFTTNGHTASMVPVLAYGPGAHLSSGVYENSDIYHKILQALGIGRESAMTREASVTSTP
mgnify:FL=1